MIDPITEHMLNEEYGTTLYHASQHQGLKIIDPSKTQSTHLKVIRRYVYASDDKSYSAGFCFSYSNREGFEYGQDGVEDPWLLKIPRKYIDRLKFPCSIYHLSNKQFKKVSNMITPEYYSKENVRVLKEEKYRSAKECLIKNGVEIKII